VISSRVAASIAVGSIIVAVAGAGVLDHARTTVDVSRHTQATTTGSGVEVTTKLSLRQVGRRTDAVADVTIINNGDKAVAYLGFACSNPASVSIVSTRPAPPGPRYSASATAVRDLVMKERHSLDAIGGYFIEAAKPAAGCDESALPTLPPHVLMAHTVTATVAFNGVPKYDAATSDVVTTLKLGVMPDPGLPPAPIQPADTIEVRTSLQQVSSFKVDSTAKLEVTAQRFDLAMKDSALSRWVDAQDPLSWGRAQLDDSYAAGATPGSDWTLVAFNRQYAVPLHAAGTRDKATDVRIPQERVSQPVVADAVIPAGATSRSKTMVPFRDLYVGDLVLPTGMVLVGDPVSSDAMLTFNLALSPGRYPLHVVTTRPRYGGYEETAWIELVLSRAQVTHWEAAVPVGHTAKELKPGEVFTFGTDGAAGGFASREAMVQMDADLGVKTYSDTLTAALAEREEGNGWLWGLLTVDSRSGANVFASSTGGDGGFPVLLGLDAQDRPAVLLTDFGGLEMDYGGIHSV
jgi:hypothetical protein